MLLRSLEVHNFRSISHAKLTFGRGLNVIHGPNELGKSTLVEALRAGFLLPVESKAAEVYIPWGLDLIPRVIIEFETQSIVKAADELEQSTDSVVIWRITKFYGKGSRGSALLERVAGSGRAVEKARGRHVEGVLRELLAWGITAPGGKGAPKGVPDSYLTTALLGEQGRVDSIFQANLDSDGTGSGRTLLTEALGALAQEPIVSDMLERLKLKTRDVFTEAGKETTKATSPLKLSSAKILKQEGLIKQIEERVHKSDEIEEAIRCMGEKRNEAEEKRTQLIRQLELSRSVLDSMKKVEISRQQLVAFQQAGTKLHAAEAELAARETTHAEAAETLQFITNHLQAAREEVARCVTKRDQLRASATTSTENKRCTLLSRRDEVDRLINEVNQLQDAAQQVELQRAELSLAQQQLQSAHCATVSTGNLLVLVRLRDQQRALQASDIELRHADDELLKQDAFRQVAVKTVQSLDEQLQAARQQVASLSARRDQLQATIQDSHETRKARLLARRDETSRDAELTRECMESSKSITSRRTEVMETEHRLQEARTAMERMRNLLDVARLEDERNQLMKSVVAQREYLAQKARVDQLQSESKSLQETLIAAQRRLQSEKDAQEHAKNNAREAQFRKQTLHASRLHALAALDRARNDLAVVRLARDNSNRLSEVKHDKDVLASQRSGIDNALSSKSADLELKASALRQVKAICIAVFIGIAGSLTLAIVFRDLAAVFGVLTAMIGVSGGLVFFKLAKIQRMFAAASIERNRVIEKRNEILTKCLMAESAFTAAQREWDQSSRQFSAHFESPDALIDQAPLRLRVAQDEVEKIEEEIRNLESLSTMPCSASSQQLDSASQVVRELEERLATNAKTIDEAHRILFSIEAQVNAADKVTKATLIGQEELDQQIVIARHRAGLKPYQPAPTVAEAEERNREAHASMSTAESQHLIETERLADRESRHAELYRTFDRPAEQILATAEADLNIINVELENLDSTVFQEVDAVDSECKKAEATEFHLKGQHDQAKSDADSVIESLNNARSSRDDRRMRFEAARSAATAPDMTAPGFFAEIVAKLAKSPREGDTDLFVVELAALDREISAIGDQLSSVSQPTLNDVETNDRETRSILTDTENRVRLAESRLTDREILYAKLVMKFDQPAENILATAEQTLILVESELKMLDTSVESEIDAADDEYQHAESLAKLLCEQKTEADGASETALSAVVAARQSREDQRIQFEMLRPKEAASSNGAETLQADAHRALEREFGISDVSESFVSELAKQLSEWSTILRTQTAELDGKRGQLGLVGGAVDREKLEQEKDRLDRLRNNGADSELEYRAAQHLLDVLKEADSKYAAHLGRSLAKPVSELFLKLTGNRYGDILLAPNLSLQNVVANTAERDPETFSIGTRDQLATLIRLSIASYLKTTLVLDDQLAHSDPFRLLWFRDRLRESVDNSNHQIIVVTCRPLDYVDASDLPPSLNVSNESKVHLRVIELSNAISHH